jgi:hypothetical protein
MADATTFDPHAFDVNWKPTTSPVGAQTDIYSNLNAGYAGAIAGQDKTPAILDRWDQRYGVPQLQSKIAGDTLQYDELGNQIRNMPKEIAQRSQESILTQGQKDRQVQSETAPLLSAQGVLGQNISRDTANLGTAESNAAKMVSAEQVDQEKELLPWLKQYDTENVLQAMRMTGWTFENEKELSRLLANQSAGVTLTNAERDRLNQLAIAEKEMQNRLDLAKAQNYTLAKGSTLVSSSGAKLGSNLGWS